MVHSLLDSWVFTSESLAVSLARHYGGEATTALSDGQWWDVVLNGAAVVTIKESPRGRVSGRCEIWVYVGGRGKSSRDSWVVGDAVAFVDEMRAIPSGLNHVMSNDGVTFRYSVEYWVTIRGGEIVNTSNDADFIGVFNAETLEDLTGVDLDLVVNTYGPLADRHAECELGLMS